MEKGQREHITKHLPDLLITTTVNAGLIAELRSRDLLHSGEANKLKGLSGDDKVTELYDIVMKKHNSYEGLKTALNKMEQTGAFVILDGYSYQEYAFPYRNVIIISYEGGIGIHPPGDTLCQFITGKFENRKVTVKKRCLETVNAKKMFDEVELLMKLDWHDNIVRYFKTELSNGYILIALEFCKVNLEDWLIRSPDEYQVYIAPVEILRQVLNGIEHLHKERTIHGNLNPKNILVTNTDKDICRVKISDFALSSMVPHKTRNEIHPTDFFPKGWSAPEVVLKFREENGCTRSRSNRVLTGFAADIFSLGCVFHYVLSDGQLHPFGKDDGRRNENIVNGIRDISIQLLESKCHIQFAEVIGEMTETSENDRPVASSIKSDTTLWTSTYSPSPAHISCKP